MEPSRLRGLRHLLKAPSPGAVEEIFKKNFALRNGELPEEIVTVTSKALKITTEDALEMHFSVRYLIKTALFECTTKEEVAELFPSGFHRDLKGLLVKIVAGYLPRWRNKAIQEQISLPRLKSTDWRIDIKSASERGRMHVPTLLVQLEVTKPPSSVGEPATTEKVTFELNKETLDTMLEGLRKIRTQLNQVAES